MKLRNQLLLAFLLLAVLPLAAIVLYTYLTSLGAFRRAVEAETRSLSEQMGERMSEVRSDLHQRLELIGSLPVTELLADEAGEGEAPEVYAELMRRLGEVSSIVQSFEFEPQVAPPPPADHGGEEKATGGVPEPAGGEPFVIYLSKTLAEAASRLERYRDRLPPDYLAETLHQVVREHRDLSPEELEALAAATAQERRLLGTDFSRPVRRGERLIGVLRPQIKVRELFREVLARTRRMEGEIPYAVGPDGSIYARDPQAEAMVAALSPSAPLRPAADVQLAPEDWILAETAEPGTGLVFGVARPIGEPLREIRLTAVRNLGAGLGVAAMALIGVVVLSRRMTRKVAVLTVGAERLAEGDLTTRVPVRSKDELGQLADAFNRMARQLADKQKMLVEQQLRHRLLAAENERKSRELEEARRLQLSLLPRELPRHPALGVAVFMRTATEVGGDYYDFALGRDGSLTAVVGDATGHGAGAGKMVMLIKGLFTADGAGADLPSFLAEASATIRRMELSRMLMSLALLRCDGDQVRYVSAGMPPLFVHRERDGAVEEVALQGFPLGGVAEPSYREWRSEVTAGDTLLLLSDGLPELADHRGEPFGYERVRQGFARAAGAATPEEVIGELSEEIERWAEGRPLADDVTFVVLRVVE